MNLGSFFFYALSKEVIHHMNVIGTYSSYEYNTFSYLMKVSFKIRKKLLATIYANNVKCISKSDY